MELSFSFKLLHLASTQKCVPKSAIHLLVSFPQAGQVNVYFGKSLN